METATLTGLRVTVAGSVPRVAETPTPGLCVLNGFAVAFSGPTSRLRQRLRQDSGNQLVQTDIGSGMPKLVQLSQSRHPLGLRILMLRIAPCQRHGARVGVDDLIEHLVNIFQCRLALGT